LGTASVGAFASSAGLASGALGGARATEVGVGVEVHASALALGSAICTIASRITGARVGGVGIERTVQREGTPFRRAHCDVVQRSDLTTALLVVVVAAAIAQLQQIFAGVGAALGGQREYDHRQSGGNNQNSKPFHNDTCALEVQEPGGGGLHHRGIFSRQARLRKEAGL